MTRKVDKDKIQRADRESRITIDAEREAREKKTARLRAQRLALETEPQREPANRRRGSGT